MTVDIPLNPAKHHLKQLKDAEIKDFEIIKQDGKYYVHISLEKEIAEKHISSVGGIDQGLNHSAGIVSLVLLKKTPYIADVKNSIKLLFQNLR